MIVLVMVAAVAVQVGDARGADAYMRPPVAIRAPRQQDTTAPSPIGNQGDWFPQDAYPAEARRANEQGRVSVRVDIDATGKPAACHIAASSGSISLDKATCDLALANARFTPARLRGKPVASQFTLRNVAWILSQPDPIDLSAGEKVMAESTMEITLAPDGTATACKATLIYPPQAPDPCTGAPIGQKSAPMIRNGVPVGGKVILRQSARLVPDAPSTP